MPEPEQRPPLHGLQVVSLGGHIAAELTLELLAQQGATVTHILRTGVPASPAVPGRVLLLDLRTADGASAARDLLLTADIAIENFRPGSMDRLGLGAGEARAISSRLIYCSLPGFSRTDASRAGTKAWESIVQATAAATHPWFEGATGTEPPVYNAIPVASAFAAFHAVTAISAALLERDHSGTGQTIEVSLYAAMYSALSALGLRIHNVHSGPNQVINFVPLVRQYRCADGRWVQIHAFTRRSIRQFARAAGAEDWIAEGVLRLGPVITDLAVRAELQSRLERLFLTRTAQQWEDVLSEAGVSCAICRTAAEWLETDHAVAAGLAILQPGGRPIPGPQLEIIPAPGPPASPSPAPRERQNPYPGGEGGTPDDSNLASLPPAAERTAPGTSGPLSGIRVLDLCIVLAGTTCGRTLAEYGADVIKIDDPNRDGGVIFHNDVNRGKRSLLLDLKSESGRATFWRLLETTDVFVENFRAGAMDRLGLGYEAVRQRRPGIVYVSLNAYGYRGPWAGRPGWEQLAEAASGMQLRYGAGGRPTLQPYAVLDFGTGVLAAHGAILALYNHQRTGRGALVRTSLIATAGTIQTTLLPDPAMDAVGGEDFRGSFWFHRYYAASDGWLLIAASPADAPAIANALGIPSLTTFAEADAAAAVERTVAVRPRAYWLARLTAARITACPVASIADVMNDPWARAHGVSLQRPHGDLGLVDTVGPVAFLDRTPLVPGRPATYPGIDAAEVLAEAGFVEAEYDALRASGALVVPQPPAAFPLPSSLFPLPSSLFPLPSSLFPLPSSLFPLPSSLFPLPYFAPTVPHPVVSNRVPPTPRRGGEPSWSPALQIVDGIYQLLTPFPDVTTENARILRVQLQEHPRVTKGLPYVLPYLLKSGGDTVLVDCGWNTDSAYQALEEGMQEHGSHPTEINKLVITHVHPDHYGMSGRLKRLSSCDVVVHEEDAKVITSRYFSPKGLTDQMATFMESNGVPALDAPTMSQGSMNMIDRVSPVPPDTEVKGGETIKVGRFNFEVIWTPGHSPGHICLYEQNQKILLTGDHVLPTITPNVSIHAQTHGSPLGDYMRSLEKLVDLDVNMVLPAHEFEITDLKKRLKEIEDHHDMRLEEMVKCVDSGGSTAWDVAGRVVWATGRLADFEPFMQRAAVGETIAHLEYLYELGRLAKVMRGKQQYWLPV